MNQTHVKDERPVTDLFTDLSREIQRLFRDEIALVKTEISNKISRGVKDVAFLAIGGVVIYSGVLAVTAAVILLLATAISPWISALIIGVVVLGVGFFMAQRGLRDLKQTDFTPYKTITSLKEDKEWMKRRT